MSSTPQHRHELRGLRSSTLGNYLAALGLFRVVAEQADESATLQWQGDTPVVTTRLGADQLVSFLTDDYRPSPVVAPWNGGSYGGFAPGADDRHAKAIQVFESSGEPRFTPMCDAIRVARSVVADPRWASAMNDTNKQRGKAAAITLLRNRLDDAAIEFVDASVALTEERPNYPPVLGTGGNIGRLDLVVTFWERLHYVCGLTKRKKNDPTPDELARSLITGEPIPLLKGSFGQYDSKGAGGVNEARAGEAPGLVNPWVVVLSIEGSLLMATSITRRLGADASIAVAPFSVGASAHGFASAAADESSGGEFWAPRWATPAKLLELRALMSEGRATWQGMQARSGVDFIRAIRSFGVSRGIDSFVRFGFPERNGQMRVAVPLGTYVVRDDPRVRLTAELDEWLARTRRHGEGSAVVASLHRRLLEAVFAASADPTPRGFRRILALVADLEWALSRSRSARDNGAQPAPMLTASQWLPTLDDGTPEFRVALAIASGSNQRLERRSDWPEAVAMCELLRPVRFNGSGRAGWWTFTERHPLVGADRRPVIDLLVDAAIYRARGESATPLPDTVAYVGCHPRFPRAWEAPRADVALLAKGALDEALLAQWVRVLALFGPRALWDRVPTLSLPNRSAPDAHAPAWTLLEPLFRPPANGKRAAPVPRHWPRLLSAGRTSTVFREAETRLRLARAAERDTAADAATTVIPTSEVPRSAKATDLPVVESRRMLAALFAPTLPPREIGRSGTSTPDTHDVAPSERGPEPVNDTHEAIGV